MNRSSKKVVFYVLLMFVGVQTFGQEIYSQPKVKRIYNFFSLFGNYSGELLLDGEKVNFKSSQETKQRHDFEILYKDIKAVKRKITFLVPNRIYIYTTDGGKIKLFTYKRKKIIDTIRANMKKE